MNEANARLLRGCQSAVVTVFECVCSQTKPKLCFGAERVNSISDWIDQKAERQRKGK